MVIEIIVIVLTILIIYQSFSYKKCSTMVVRPSAMNSINKVELEEVFDYPACTGVGCLSVSNQIKPRFKYNLSDGRCIKNITYNYINKSELDNIINYSSTYDNPSITGCSNLYNTLYSSVIGQYIKIESPNDIKLNELSVYPKNGSSVLNNASTYTYNDGKNIIIDLTQPLEIGYIFIKHNTALDSSSLVNAKIYVLNNISNNIDTGNKVFSYTIDGTPLTRKIYTQNFLGSGTGPSTITAAITWPGCSGSGCLQSNNNLFKNFQYSFSDGRCFRPISYSVTGTYLTDLSNDNFDNINQFTSCSTSTDTRYIPPIGRFIILKKTGINQRIKVSQLNIFNGTEILLPETAHANPCANANYGEYMIENTGKVAEAFGTNPYLLVDLGGDVRITTISITSPTTFQDLDGSTLSIVKQDYTVVSNNTIMGSTDTTRIISLYKNYTERIITILKLPLSYNASDPNVTNNGIIFTTNFPLLNERAGYNNGTATNYIRTVINTIPANTEYIIQGWVRLGVSSTSIKTVFELGSANNNISLNLLNTTHQLIINGTTISIPLTAFPVNQWTFFVLTRVMTTTLTTYLYTGSNTMSSVWNSGSYNGSFNSGNITLFNSSNLLNPFNGHIRDFNIIIAKSFIPTAVPTEPLDSVRVFETYDYPACTGTNSDCITLSKSTKPRFRYKLSNNRCVIGKDFPPKCDNCLDSINNYTMSDTDILNNVSSCYPSYETRFPTVVGRYIKVTRINGSTLSLSFSKIDAVDKYNISLIDQTTTAFVRPLSGTSYARLVLDSDPNTIMTTGTNSLDDVNASNIFIQIDLITNKEIMYVDLIMGPSMTSLINTQLIIANNNLDIVYQKILG